MLNKDVPRRICSNLWPMTKLSRVKQASSVKLIFAAHVTESPITYRGCYGNIQTY